MQSHHVAPNSYSSDLPALTDVEKHATITGHMRMVEKHCLTLIPGKQRALPFMVTALSWRDDIVFKDPLNTFAGINNYKHIFWALRFHGRIFFKALWIDIISVWQPVENLIMIRWTVHGIARVPWESVGRFDGTSEYKLDKDGKIYEHRVDNIALNSPPPKFRVLAVEDLIQSLGCPSTPKPTYFEVASFQCLVLYVPLLLRFTWVRYYMAFYLTLAWRCAAAT